MIRKIFKMSKDPYDTIMTWLTASGQLRTKQTPIKSIGMTVFGFIVCNYSWFGPFMAAALSEGIDTADRMGSVVYGLTGFHVTLKVINCYTRQKEVKELISFPKLIWTAQNVKNFGELKKEADRRSKKASFLIWFSVESLIPIIILKSIIDNRGKSIDERKIPFNCWFPLLDPKEWFLTNCVLSTTTLLVEVTNASVYYSFLKYSAIQAACLLKILGESLETTNMDIRDALYMHSLAIRYVEKINNFFAGQMVFEACIYGLQIAATGYRSSKMVRTQLSKETFETVFYVLAFVIYIGFSYLNCSCGQEITTQSEKLFASIYQNRWYERPVREQKDLNIIMSVANRSLQVQYKRLMVINMERYALILQATYSYITLLSGFDI